MKRSGLLCPIFLLTATFAWAGPPFTTDDPVPVDYHHWEVYFASHYDHDAGGASGTMPEIELNYGALPNLQLHLIAPGAFAAPAGGERAFGYGDTEFGAKYRFVAEGEDRPQVAIFPLVEVPTGDAARGLGSGHTQVFLPVWLQKTEGAWTTYGGGGYWFNPGAGNRNWWLLGWLVQRQVAQHLAVGVEIFHETAQTDTGSSATKLNVGLVYDLNDTVHLLASAGPTLRGSSGYQAYFALQLTLGPASDESTK